MKKINLKNNGVYFFSGESNLEKITFLEGIVKKNNIKNNCIFDIHDIRRFIFGDHYTYDIEEKQIYQISYGFEDFNVIETLLNIIKMRSKQGLLTIIDIEKLTEKQNKKLVNYFKDRKINFDFFDFKNENNLDNKEVNLDTDITVELFELKDSKIDVVGDVHGLYNEFIQFIKNLGYEVNNYNITHKDNRKLLFLGDVVDRGQQSVEMLKLLYNSVTFNGHYAIIGNHENKLLQFKKHYQKFDNVLSFNNATSETILELLKLNKTEMFKYLDFIEELPHYYTYQDIAFAHGNLDYFEPTSVIKSKMMYGSGKSSSTDLKYQILFDKGINNYTLIRGHYIQEKDYNNVFSLEKEQAFNGHLAILHLDKFIEDKKDGDNISAFKNNTKLFKIDFDFNIHSKKFNFIKKLDEYCKEGLLIKMLNNNNFFTLYKYSDTFYKSNLLSVDEDLNKTNGLVVDFASNIVINPIERMFNFKSLPNKNIYKNQSFIAREKINGVNFNIGYNKIDKKLIYSSSNFIFDFKLKAIIDKIPKEFTDILNNFLNNGLHTISLSYSYKDKEFYLINIKKNSKKHIEYKEKELDEIVKKWSIKCIRRPTWNMLSFEEINEKVKNNKSSFIVKSLIEEDYLFYIDNLYSEMYKFLKLLTKENKNKISKNKIPNSFNRKEKELTKFFINSKYKTKLFFLKEYDYIDILDIYFKSK